MSSLNVFLVYVLFVGTRRSLADLFHNESRLHKNLFADYCKMARPVRNLADAVNVSLGLSNIRFHDLNEGANTITISYYQSTSWNDPRLTWDSDKYGGIESIRVPTKDVWLPDIEIYNESPGGTHLISNTVVVTSMGHVLFSPYRTVSTYCFFDFSAFPYDEQHCWLNMGSWTYGKWQLAIGHWGKPFSQLDEIIDVHLEKNTEYNAYMYKHSEWTITSANARTETTVYECCPEPYLTFKVDLKLKRNSTFYRYLLVTPAVIFVLLLPLVFCLPADASNKITLGLSIIIFELLLMIIGVDTGIYNHSILPRLAIFHMTILVLSSVSMVFATFVNAVCQNKPNVRQLPAWIRTIFLESRCVRILLFLECSPRQNTSGYEMNKNLLEDANTNPGELTLINNDPSHSLSHIAESVKVMTDRACAKDQNDRLCREWMEFARVVDRLMLLIFFIMAILVLAVFLR